VVALIDAARETRAMSGRLRAEALGARLIAKRREREMLLHLRRATETRNRTILCIARVRRSPWSDLPWQALDDELEHVVVLLPLPS